MIKLRFYKITFRNNITSDVLIKYAISCCKFNILPLAKREFFQYATNNDLYRKIRKAKNIDNSKCIRIYDYADFIIEEVLNDEIHNVELDDLIYNECLLFSDY